MKIPSDPVERLTMYNELALKIFETREERRQFYTVMRSYNEQGGLDSEAYPIFNNLGAHLELVASMIYAQDTTRFSINPDATENAKVFEKLPIAAQRVQQEWHDSNCDAVFGEVVGTGLVCGAGLVKLVWNNGLHPFEVMPENFGVLREDVPMLSRQQAFGEKYLITLAALRTMLRVHPRGAEIMEKVTPSKKPEDQPQTSEQRGPFMSSFDASGQMAGNVAMPTGFITQPTAKVTELQIEVMDLWIWDDDAHDYKVVTMAEPNVIIYERNADDGREKTLFLKGENPYVVIRPTPDSKNFWGRSEANKLRPLQDWLTERLWGIRKMLRRQSNPPKVGSGLYGDDSEISDALTTPGNYVPGDTIGGFKIEELKPEIPEDLFRDVMNIMEMFNQVSGLPKAMQGQGDAGVRSENHAMSLIRTGSSRVKRKALQVEDPLNRAATLILKLLKKYNNDQLLATDGNPFLLAQLGSEVEVKVDAHSSSPAFMEDMKQWAADMFKAGLIDADEYFDLTNPPMREILKSKARVMQAARAATEAREKREDRVIELAKVQAHRAA